MLDKEQGKELFRRFRSNRKGVRTTPAMASLCLICGSTNVVPLAGHTPPAMHCQNCGFDFVRYDCAICGETIDGRDPQNPPCQECDWRVCVCSACDPAGCSGHEQRSGSGEGP